MCLEKQTFMHAVDIHKLNELEKKLLELGSYTTLLSGWL